MWRLEKLESRDVPAFVACAMFVLVGDGEAVGAQHDGEAAPLLSRLWPSPESTSQGTALSGVFLLKASPFLQCRAVRDFCGQKTSLNLWTKNDLRV